MPRFFADQCNITDTDIKIVGEDAYHIARSLRMAVGDFVTVSDGGGLDYYCSLLSIHDEVCVCKIINKEKSKVEPRCHITLFMAYPKGDKLEVVVQKAVELGASEIVPFESSRCIKRPKAEKQERITERLNKIAKEAAKQSGRAILPTVSHAVSFSKMLDLATKSELALLCYESEEGKTLKGAIGERDIPKSLACIVGCEGGFSREEAEEAIARGIVSVSLGRRILRCETAPDFILSALEYEFEL
jgi:16S rRNA (uracil1498-N3)-methyltransferase